MRKICLLLFISLFASIVAQNKPTTTEPSIEVRAAWLTTNWGLDWPKTKTAEAQKKELEEILDQLQESNFNVVLFQARAQGKAFYRSSIEPVSPYFDNRNDFDPLAFAIEACHARGMECHAWITTFPVDKIKKTKKGVVTEKKPDYYKQSDGYWFLDPGRIETKEHLIFIAKELTKQYDVDGIHLDYIRYPDRAEKYKDDDSYRKSDRTKSKEDWRRDNINSIVSEVYDAVKGIKKWVQVSSAPIGKYKTLRSGADWTAYDSVHQDAAFWMQQGKHDMLFPMMYFEEPDFELYTKQWIDVSGNKPVIPGLAAYKLEKREKDWSVAEIANQIEQTRLLGGAGQAYFRTGQIINNEKGLRNTIDSFYKYPAKLPPLTWLDNQIPQAPTDFKVYRTDDGDLFMSWSPADAENRYTYNIYYGRKDQLNPDRADLLIATNLHQEEYRFPASVGEYGFYYFVTASDRYHNESTSAPSVFFVHSTDIH